MNSVGAVSQFLDKQFPTILAEPWDNTGLLVGDQHRMVESIMCCLTLAPKTIDEAIERRADLVISHHPLPFRPISQITTDSSTGASLLRIILAGISVYSPHTRFDSASFGINEFLARQLGILEVTPLVELARDLEQAQGSGRIGKLASPISWVEWIQVVKRSLGTSAVRGVATGRASVQRVAVACGSGGSLLAAAINQGCDVFVTGEANFHACLECENQGVGMVLLGHYQSERFGIKHLATRVQEEFPDLEVWASERESDPIGSY